MSRFSPPPACGLPAYVGLSRPLPVEQPLYAGAAHAPFRPREEAVADLGRNVSLPCLQDRKALLHSFDTLRTQIARRNQIRAPEDARKHFRHHRRTLR